MAKQSSMISVPVPTDLFLALYDFLEGHNPGRDPVEVVSAAIEYWIENADPAVGPPTEAGVGKGFQWKTAFLPNGTEVKMHYRGEVHHAEVQGGKFTVEGEATSPSAFVQAVTGTIRNAWRDLQVKRPGDRTWISAQALRERR